MLLAGVRPELQAALDRLCIVERLGGAKVFPEQERDYSATLSAIRAAYDSIGLERVNRHSRAPAYYLV